MNHRMQKGATNNIKDILHFTIVSEMALPFREILPASRFSSNEVHHMMASIGGTVPTDNTISPGYGITNKTENKKRMSFIHS